MKKWFKRIVVGSLITFIGLIGLVWLLAYVYQDDLKTYVAESVNENLNRDIAIGEKGIDYNVLSHFPNIAVELPEVRIANPEHIEGLLLNVEKVYIVFDLFSIISGEFVINEISVAEGELNILFDSDGLPNYKIWNDAKESKESNGLMIENINLEGLKFLYSDFRKNQKVCIDVKNLNIVPLSLNNTIQLESSLDANLKSIDIDGFELDTSIVLNGAVNYFAKNKKIGVSYLGELLGSNSNLNFDFSMNEKQDSLDFSFKLDDFGISRIVNVLPNKVRSTLLNSASGRISLEGAINGDINAPSIHVNYRITKGAVGIHQERISNIKANGEFIQSSLFNTRKGKIVVNQLSGNFLNSNFEGSLELENFKSPWVKTKMNCNVDLGELYSNFSLTQFDALKGMVNLNAQLSGGIQDLLGNNRRKSIRNFKSNGKIHFDGLEILPKGFSNQINFETGDLTFDNKDLTIVNLNGQVNNSKFDMNGKLTNFLKTIFSNAPLTFNAKLNIDQLKLEEFITAEGSDVADSAYYFSLPEDILLDVKLNLGDFKFRKFHAQDIKGAMLLKNQRLAFTKMQFKTCSGSALVSGKIEASYAKKVLFECSADLKNIDATEAFNEFENFGQDFLLAKHVKGRITTDIYLLAETDKQLNVLKDKIYTKTKIKIIDGELTSFEPLIELEEFLNEEFKLNFNLKQLKFKTLENDIEVINKKISIPEMAIRTNDLNMDISGTHTFDQVIDYSFKVKHSDIFKASKENKIDKEYGVVENNDKTATLPLKMTGTVDDPKFSYDIKKKTDIIRENLKKEGQNIIKLIKDEFKGSKEKQEQKEKNKKEQDELNQERTKTKFQVGGIDDEDEDEDEEEEDYEDEL